MFCIIRIDVQDKHDDHDDDESTDEIEGNYTQEESVDEKHNKIDLDKTEENDDN
jgi:hypothetical protein